MTTILFQGDSITDCGRVRDNDIVLGVGYPQRIAGKFNYEQPGKYTFINRGIGGNRIVDIYARIKNDIINVKPDIMSILIGINDVGSEIRNENGVSAEKYEKIYDMLISEILEELPDIKIMIMEPFVLKSSGTEDVWDRYSTEVAKRSAAAKRIAQKYNLTFVPLQEKFNEMVAKQPEPYWTSEGFHPTYAGHELIAREWIKAFEAL